jgi:hypothetical protein
MANAKKIKYIISVYSHVSLPPSAINKEGYVLKDIYVTPNTKSIKCFADNLFISFPPISKYKLSLFYYSQKNEY